MQKIDFMCRQCHSVVQGFGLNTKRTLVKHQRFSLLLDCRCDLTSQLSLALSQWFFCHNRLLWGVCENTIASRLPIQGRQEENLVQHNLIDSVGSNSKSLTLISLFQLYLRPAQFLKCFLVIDNSHNLLCIQNIKK